ncbi:MAG: hypothetical protein RIR73_938 [Chloroflexota bacterium]
MRLPAFTGWGYSKDMPRFASKTFRDTYRKSDIGNREVPLQSIIAKQPANIPTFLPSNLIEQFATELAALSGNVHQTHNATQSIIEYLISKHITKIYLQPNVLDETLLHQAGIDFTHNPDPALTVGVTKAWVGLADTGSVLEADDELLGSLLPEIHLTVLESKNILPSLPDAIEMTKGKNAVFITGPSRTADIEMTLTIGVHGPKEIHVFVDDSKRG